MVFCGIIEEERGWTREELSHASELATSHTSDGPPRLTTISSFIFLQPVSEGAVWNGRHRNTEEGGADGNCILCQTRNSSNGFCCIVTSYVLPSMRVLGGPERGNQGLLEKPLYFPENQMSYWACVNERRNWGSQKGCSCVASWLEIGMCHGKSLTLLFFLTWPDFSRHLL